MDLTQLLIGAFALALAFLWQLAHGSRAARREADDYRRRFEVAETAANHWKARANELAHDRDEWKGRASRILDQVGVRDGILASPALAAPEPERDTNPLHRVMAAVGVQELTRKAPNPRPPQADSVLGVNEHAVSEVLGAVIPR